MRVDHDDDSQVTETTQADLASRRRSFGVKLQQLRSQHGVSVAALAEITRISQVFIEALEAGAMERLPGRVFGRGFVQNIAKNFGEDPEPWLAEFADVWESTSVPSVLKVQIKNKPTKDFSDRFQPIAAQLTSLARRGEIVKIALPILAIVIVGYLSVSRSLVQNAWRNFSSRHAATIVKAKPLDLRPVDTNQNVNEGSAAPEVGPSVVASSSTLGALEAPKPTETKGKFTSGVKEEQIAPGAGVKNTSSSSSDAALVAKPATAKSTQDATVTTNIKAVEKETKQTVVATTEGQQQLVIAVTEPVRIKLDVDQGPSVTRELQPDTYKFGFNKKADMLIYDAAAVQISFNGKALGTLGNKGRVRRLSFQNQVPQSKSM